MSIIKIGEVEFLYAYSPDSIFLSVDQGSNWQLENEKFYYNSLNIVSSYNNSLIAGTDGGIMQSTSSTDSWRFINNGLPGLDLSRVIIDKDSNYVVSTKGAGLFKQNNNHWLPINNGLTTLSIQDLVIHNDQIFISTAENIFKFGSQDSWEKIADFGADVLNFTRNGDLVASNSKNIFTTNDLKIWNLLKSVDDNWNIISVALDSSDQIYCQSYYSHTEPHGSDLASLEFYNWVSSSWTQFLPAPDYMGISNIAFVSDSKIYYIAYGSAYQYNPSGYDPPVYDINNSALHYNSKAIVKTNNDKILIGGNKGVFMSIDGGETWTSENQGLSAQIINAAVLDEHGIVTIASDQGLFETNNSILKNIIPDELIYTFQLYSNYPNPFNPETTIHYSLPSGQVGYDVSLKVYNTLGQLVTDLVEARQKPGEYSIKWNGKNSTGVDMPSGVYFCVLQAGNHKATQKMLLVRSICYIIFIRRFINHEDFFVKFRNKNSIEYRITELICDTFPWLINICFQIETFILYTCQ